MDLKKVSGLFLFIFLIITQLYGQDINSSYTLKWQAPCYEKISEDIVISYLYFDGASLYQTIKKQTPCFWKAFPLNEPVRADIAVVDQLWQPMTKEEIDLIDIELVKDTLSVKVYVEYTRKVPALKVEFFPFRKRGNQYEKLLSFRMQGNLQAVPPQKEHKSQTYTHNSILNNDGFYKIAIENTGIHKITYDNLTSLGVNTSSLNVANIAVFGNGGRRLPESTSDSVVDDLQEVAIEVVDVNGNGILDKEDYILFYGIGIMNWIYNQGANPPFSHDLNFYTNNAYYFINVNAGVGDKKRIIPIFSTPSPPTNTVNSYRYYDVIEKDLVNVNSFGRIWFGDEYNYPTTSRDYSFSVPGISKSDKLYLRVQVGAKSLVPSSFLINVNNASSFSVSLSGGSADGSVNGDQKGAMFNTYIPTSDDINIKATYNKPVNSAVGWLDYIELQAVRSLAQHSGMVSFRNPEIVGVGNVANYQFDTKGKNTQIWDVTDPYNAKKINADRNGNILSFSLEADRLREFVAFDGSSFYAVTPVGGVARQNLHGLSGLDFIIITHPNFIDAAEKLAAFRRSNDNMRVAVVTTTQVYNEFGSGAADIAAIRNFLKMFYDRETLNNIPRNVLLLGNTSYDFRDIEKKSSCFIPNYQGSAPFSLDACPSADNFFVKLADGKGNGNAGTTDMGIGRFPVKTTMQANNLVQKSINYASYQDLAASAGGMYESNLGSWRNIISFLADDIDMRDGREDPSMFHMKNAEAVCYQIVKNQPFLNIDKIYADAYKKSSSSAGARFTEVTNAMNARINNGCLMFTYFGHGGDNGFGHERIFLRSDLNNWKNKYCLPFIYTACCSFAKYDKTNGTSPAEDILLKADGGAIALISSARNSSPSTNETFGKNIYARAFEQNIENKYLTLGEIYSKAYADAGGNSIDMYVLLGDPSATLAHPKYNVITDSINGLCISTYTDTIKALKFVTIKGHITDNNNVLLTNFNGWVYPTIYDKTDTLSTINPNMDFQRRFAMQKSIIFKGKSSVKNGYFSFSFMVPKDINYEYGMGKISYYAKGNGYDAKGYDTMLVGGMHDTIIHDDKGPDISLYFNDMKFVNGGLTSPTPTLIAKISDESGINTTGAGIGHDIVAIIDGDMAKSIVLNDYFEYDTNSFTSGSLSYVLGTLSEGPHTLTLRAWDIINNMGEASINFEVVKDEDLKLKHVLNYPNPFTTSTQFFFEHNRPNTLLNIRIQILTISGKVVRTLISPYPQTIQTNAGFRSEPIQWDGLDDFGDKLARGVYIYRLQVMTPDGKSAEKIEKLVIL